MAANPKNRNDGLLRTPMGAPVDDDDHSKTAGDPLGGEVGPVILDHNLLTKLAHFDRERIPERVVHAKGGAAHGYFEVTHDVSKYTKANFLQIPGKRTEVFVRFSTVAGESGTPDAVRDPRGFAIKHYTEEGNYDMVGNNIPIFFIRDPQKFPDFIHSQKRNPRTNLPDPDSVWDFWSLKPESLHCATMILSDKGIPATWRHMNGYSSHTFKWVNKDGQAWWVKYHYKTDQKSVNLTNEQAASIRCKDLDNHIRDLQDAIDAGDFPSWTVHVQLMPVGEERNYRWNPFDMTKVWPHSDYPLIPFGKLVLNRNPENYFAEVEQVAFSPGHLVPGIEASPDPMLMGRLFSYPDTHRHRLGVNYHQIPINAPRCPYASYARAGGMRVDGNGGASCNYWPNSRGGQRPNRFFADTAQATECPRNKVARFDVKVKDDDFFQANQLWSKVFDEGQRRRTAANAAGMLKQCRPVVIKRSLNALARINPQYRKYVEEAMAAKPSMASKSKEELLAIIQDKEAGLMQMQKKLDELSGRATGSSFLNNGSVL